MARSTPPAGAPRRTFSSLWPHLAVLLVVTGLAFSPALGNQLVRWDDYAYVVDNPVIRELSLRNLVYIFDPRTFVLDNYHPVTILSYAIEYAFVGPAPTLYHLDNLILHLLNVVCVAYVAWLLTQRTVPTLACAALFAVHPMRVESVVWAAERKDLLYAFFFLLSLIAYIHYARSPGSGRGFYAMALVGLLLSSLAKAQGVTLPLTFLLVDYVLGRSDGKRLLLEKLPFLAISLSLGAWAIVAQKTSITAERLAAHSFPDRLAIASYNLLAYLYKLVVPFPLAAFYGYPASLGLVRWAFVPVLVLAGLFFRFARRDRFAVFGVLFFLATFIVVSQLLPIGNAIIADRFTYIPYLGLFLCAGVGFDGLMVRAGGVRTLAMTVAALALVVLVGMTWMQTRTWHDTESLWRQVLSVDPDEPRAHHNLGVIEFERNRPQVAIAHFDAAVRHGAGYDRLDDVYRNLGAAYGSLGRDDEAIRAYDRAVRANPKAGASWWGRGLVHARTGALDSAVADYSRALALDSTSADAWFSRGNARRRLGRNAEAIEDYSKAIAVKPDYASAFSNRANCYLDTGRLDLAIEDYTTALRLAPNEGFNYLNRSKAYYRQGNLDGARADYDAAAQRGASDEGFLLLLRSARGE